MFADCGSHTEIAVRLRSRKSCSPAPGPFQRLISSNSSRVIFGRCAFVLVDLRGNFDAPYWIHFTSCSLNARFTQRNNNNCLREMVVAWWWVFYWPRLLLLLSLRFVPRSFVGKIQSASNGNFCCCRDGVAVSPFKWLFALIFFCSDWILNTLT